MAIASRNELWQFNLHTLHICTLRDYIVYRAVLQVITCNSPTHCLLGDVGHWLFIHIFLVAYFVTLGGGRTSLVYH